MSSLGFGALLAIFLAAGAATWIAGLYLSRATDVLDDRFHLGEAVGGMLLLGLVRPGWNEALGHKLIDVVVIAVVYAVDVL